jgi:hypothetical protein
VRVVRIELAEGAARKRFVLTRRAEGRAIEGGRRLLVATIFFTRACAGDAQTSSAPVATIQDTLPKIFAA